MTPSPRHARRSGAISTSTIAAGRIRALTAARPITPTSPRCPSAWQPNPAEAPLIDAEKLFRQPGPRQMNEAKTNQPVGKTYNITFSKWLTTYRLNDMDKGDRSRLFTV